MSKSKEERNSSEGTGSRAATEDKLQGGAVGKAVGEWGKRQSVKGSVTHIKKHGRVLSSQGSDGREQSSRTSEEGTAGLQPEPGGEERQFWEALLEGDMLYFVVDEAKGPRERADPGWREGF